MEEINLLPMVIDEVISWPDGRIKRITVSCEGKPILIKVMDGEHKRITNDEIPYFEIPLGRIHEFYKRIGRIISDGKKTAERFKAVAKADWATGLEACGIIIAADGKVIVPRRHINKETGEKKRVLMPAKDINSAIRMQDHIMEFYHDSLPAELNRLLAKLHIIRPTIELRRATLLYARDQMRATLNEAYDRYKRIAALTAAKNGPDFVKLAVKIAELAFLLKNQWSCPYLAEIKEIRSRLTEAKRAAAGENLEAVLMLLLSVRLMLKAMVEESLKLGKKLVDIDPIATLAEVDRSGLTDEVMVIAKTRLTGELFLLADMLVISREVIEWGKIRRVDTTSRPAASPRAVSPRLTDKTAARPRRRVQRKKINPRYEQAAFDLR